MGRDPRHEHRPPRRRHHLRGFSLSGRGASRAAWKFAPTCSSSRTFTGPTPRRPSRHRAHRASRQRLCARPDHRRAEHPPRPQPQRGPGLQSRQLWADLQPEGRIDLRCHLTREPGQPLMHKENDAHGPRPVADLPLFSLSHPPRDGGDSHRREPGDDQEPGGPRRRVAPGGLGHHRSPARGRPAQSAGPAGRGRRTG